LHATAFGVGMMSVGSLGLRVGTLPVSAQSVIETIYLTDSASRSDPSEPTRLFTVELDGSAQEAVLTELLVLTDEDFSGVDAIAASLDGETVYLVDRESRHLGTFDVPTETFTDRGEIVGLPEQTVLASFGLDGVLYAVSNETNALYAIDPDASPPTATQLVVVDGVEISGADIAFDSNGTLFLHSNVDDTLYTIDYDDASPDYGQATAVGTDDGTSFTGLAVQNAGLGDLLGSSRALDAIVVIDKTDGQRGTEYAMVTTDGTPYDYRNGDMSVGRLIDDDCDPCELDGPVKYEFEGGDFELDGSGDAGIRYGPGSYTSKDDEENEPISVTFETDYCVLWAVVKAGRGLDVQELVTEDGVVTAVAPDKYAISFVEFHCTEADAEDAAASFPSNGGNGSDSASQGRNR
jgi:sugar lactone lactonase YvrE